MLWDNASFSSCTGLGSHCGREKGGEEGRGERGIDKEGGERVYM